MHTTADKPYTKNPVKHGSNTGSLLLVAALAGAAAGILLAPKKGTEMREDLKGRYNEMKYRTQSSAQDAHDKMSETVDAANNKIQNVADKTNDTADQTAEKAKSNSKRSGKTADDDDDVFSDPSTHTRL